MDLLACTAKRPFLKVNFQIASLQPRCKSVVWTAPAKNGMQTGDQFAKAKGFRYAIGISLSSRSSAREDLD